MYWVLVWARTSASLTGDATAGDISERNLIVGRLWGLLGRVPLKML